jgi:hypothetical protein
LPIQARVRLVSEARDRSYVVRHGACGLLAQRLGLIHGMLVFDVGLS